MMKTSNFSPALRQVVLVGFSTLISVQTAFSMPILMDRYNEHTQSKAQLRDECVICHVYEDGSGPLTAFGKRYDRTHLEFTTSLIQQYPNLFLIDGATDSAESTPMAANADPASQKPVMVPGNEPFEARKYYLKECKECHGKYGDGDPFQGVPAFATPKWIAERSALTDELVRIIMVGKDKMIGQAGKITEADAHELLELIRMIAEKYQ
jgi:hypothetical protein